MTNNTDTDVHFACKVSELMTYCGLSASPDYISDCVLDIYEDVPGDLDLWIFAERLTDALTEDTPNCDKELDIVMQCVCMAISDTYAHLDGKSHGVPVDRVTSDDDVLSGILCKARDGLTLAHREVHYIGAALMGTLRADPKVGDLAAGSDGQVYTIRAVH